MLEKSFGLFYFLKQTKNLKKETKYVYVRITVDGTSRELSLKRKWLPLQWNSQSCRALGNTYDAKEINSYLDLISRKVYQARHKLMEGGRPITAEGIKNILTGNNEKKYFILEAFQQHNLKMKALVGRDITPATLTRYRTAYGHVEHFIEWMYNRKDFEVKDLDYEFISQFAFWLKTVKQCSNNTTIKYLGNFKKVILECRNRGLIKDDPFFGFKIKRNEVIPVFLTQKELQIIINKPLGVGRLNHVRNIFAFCCYTGLAYCDVYNLRECDIVIGIDGKKWIITKRQKTGAGTSLPLLPYALKILENYQNYSVGINKKVLPVLSNQKTNSYLKEIADVCGIDKNLTFHVARHTFATTITLTNGVPIESISRMLGHKSLKQTMHYAKVVDIKVSSDMDLLEDRLARA